MDNAMIPTPPAQELRPIAPVELKPSLPETAGLPSGMATPSVEMPNQEIETPLEPTPAPPISSDTVHTDGPSSRLLQADDSDLIEKEWDDHALKVIDQFGDDPSREDTEQHSISKDYLKKRFNLDVS